MTMTLVQTVTVTAAGGAASIEFTGIPQTGTDLMVVWSLEGFDNMGIYFNGVNTGTAYNTRRLRGTGAAVASSTVASSNRIEISARWGVSGEWASGQMYIPNYSDSSTKSVSIDNVSEQNATNAMQTIAAGSYSSASAITSLTLYGFGNMLAQYSSASLYLVTKGSGGASVS